MKKKIHQRTLGRQRKDQDHSVTTACQTRFDKTIYKRL